MRRRYADGYRGWPVAPRDRQHPVRGSFLDPRKSSHQVAESYHHGIDVSVRDDRPEQGAPPGRTHRVYALEGGEVWQVGPRNRNGESIVRLGHFGYGHVDPVVSLGQVVQAGDMLGWTMEGQWHLHLSEWVFPDGDRERRIPVDPLDRRGKISPYADEAAPVVQDVRFFTPAEPRWRCGLGRAVCPPAGRELDPAALSGTVDVRARIEDDQSFVGFWEELWRLETRHHPARVKLKVVRLDDGGVVVERDVFRTDVTLDLEGPAPIPFSHHYAPGTSQNLRAKTAIKLSRQGRGELWFRLFARPGGAAPYWDTTTVPNGGYRLRIAAWDVTGNKTVHTVDVAVANP
jgi:hypothetical protein